MNRTLAIIVAMLLLAAGASHAEAPAESLLSAGRVDLAIVNLQNRIRQSPNDSEAYHLLSRAYFSLRRWDDSINAARKAVAIEPNNSDYHLWLGRAIGEKAESSSWFTAISLAKKVRAEFERAVQLNSSNVNAQSDLTEFYLEAPSFLGGGKDKARSQARRIAAFNPAEAHWIEARIAEKDGNWKVAENEYRAAIQASGNQANYWLSLASFYRRRNRLNDMEDAVYRASNGVIKKSDVWVDAAEVLYKGGRNFPAAIGYLRKYLASNSTVEDAPAFQAHYLLGTILEKEGDKQAAAEEYRAALSMAHEFSAAQDALARVNR